MVVLVPSSERTTRMGKSAASARKPRKIARQSRSEATVTAIIEAATRILRDGGAAALTTNHIARVAGVSVGSLYQYFPNKEAIVVALIEAQLQRDAGFAESFSPSKGEPLDATLRRYTKQVCERQYELAPLLAQLLRLLSPLGQDQVVSDYLDRMCLAFERLLLAHSSQLRPGLQDDDTRERTVRFLADAMRGALNSVTQRDPSLLLNPAVHEDAFLLARGLLLR